MHDERELFSGTLFLGGRLKKLSSLAMLLATLLIMRRPIQAKKALSMLAIVAVEIHPLVVSSYEDGSANAIAKGNG